MKSNFTLSLGYPDPSLKQPCPEGKRWGSTTYSMNLEISAISLAGRRRYRWIPFESLVFPVNQKILKKKKIILNVSVWLNIMNDTHRDVMKKE